MTSCTTPSCTTSFSLSGFLAPFLTAAAAPSVGGVVAAVAAADAVAAPSPGAGPPCSSGSCHRTERREYDGRTKRREKGKIKRERMP